MSSALELLNKQQRCFVSNEELMMDKFGISRNLNSHDKPINCLCWSANGRHLLSGAEHGIVKLWSVDGSLLSTQQTCATGSLESLKFLPYSEERVYAYNDTFNNLYVHDFTREEVLAAPKFGLIRDICTQEYQPHCIYCLCTDSNLKIYDLRAGKPFSTSFGIDTDRKSFDLCRDRPELISFGTTNGMIEVYDVRYCANPPVMKLSSAENALMVAHNTLNTIRNIHFNERGTEIIVNDWFGTGYLFDLTEGAFQLRRKVEGLIRNALKYPKSERGKVDSAQFERTVSMMQELMEKRRYTKAIEESSVALYGKTIFEPHQVSILRHLKTICHSKRGWVGDRYMCLREIIQAYEMNPASCHILYDLIKQLAAFDQYPLALKLVHLYKKKFIGDTAPSINLLQSQILYNEKKPHREHFQVMNDCDFKDFKQRFIGFNNTYTSYKDMHFFGSHQQYIVASTYVSTFIVYGKNDALVKIAMHTPEDKMRMSLPNPVQPIIATGHDSGSIKFWEPMLSNEQDIHRIDDNFNLGRFFTPKIISINDYSETHAEEVSVEGECRMT